MNRNRVNGGDSLIIKVRYTHNGETMARKISVHKYVKLEELEYKLRERFDVDYDKLIELYYYDDDKDRVVVSFEDELALAFENTNVPVFEISIKPKIADGVYTYPHLQKGKPGECVDVLVESEYLTLENATRSDTRAWGTHVYTEDSDIVKVLGHSGKITLPDSPPHYNVMVTLRYTNGNLKYLGSSSNGITTMDYGPYEISYFIENVRTVPATIREKDSFSISLKSDN